MLALTGAIPALVVMWIFDRMDRKRPEPRWSLRKVALAGALSTIPVIIVQLTLGFSQDGTYASAAWNGFVVAGFTEEAAKFVCVLILVWDRPEFDERMDGITYGVRAGLGFALIENILYLHSALESGQFIVVWVGRALLAVPGHAIWAGFLGYFAARKRFDGRGPGMIGGFVLAVFLHGLYDFALFSAPSLSADVGDSAIVLILGIPILVILGGAYWLRKLARRAVADDDRAAMAVASSQPKPPT